MLFYRHEGNELELEILLTAQKALISAPSLMARGKKVGCGAGVYLPAPSGGK
ncbi:hypothetical protein ACNKHU_19585 [Shigella flexneri]